MMITCHIKVRTLEQAWLQVIAEIMDRGREYRKDGGSRAGMLRKALDLMVVEISHPEERPLVPLARPGLIGTITEDDAEGYLREYLYNTEDPAEHESYTYAQYLTPAIHATARHYAQAGFYVQQAIMPVGMPDDVVRYVEPHDRDTISIPCLRMIDTRIIKAPCEKCFGGGTVPVGRPIEIKDCEICQGTGQGEDYLYYYVYFRAWNHFGAFPLNMAGIQLLKEIHCAVIGHESGKQVFPGPTVAMSKDSHINDIEWDAANAWLGR
jgi:thymidylate synthase